ncbi:MAG: type III-A CRISPR-associated protein Csm2 [Candidatus Woesearchaeota archaeon]
MSINNGWNKDFGIGMNNKEEDYTSLVKLCLDEKKDYLKFIEELEKKIKSFSITTSQLRKFYDMIFEVSDDANDEEKKAILYRMRILLEYAKGRRTIDENREYKFFKQLIEETMKNIDKFELFKESFEAIVAFSKDKKR